MISATKARRLGILVLAAALLLTSCGGGAKAATMHLRRTEGKVSVSDGGGKDVEPREDLGLYSGYGVDTRSESYAWIDLDSVKLTKLDEDSEIAITKEGKDLEIEVLSGSLFFDVTQPLEADETMTIRSSTMLVGVRGTCGWVSLSEDEEQLSVYLLEGKVRCEADGEKETVKAGEMAVMTGDGEITVSPFAEADVPEFVMEELDEDFLDEVRSFLPQGVSPEIRAALASIRYYGDPAQCAMTPEQAAAFLQTIRDNMAKLEEQENNIVGSDGRLIAGILWGKLSSDYPPTSTAALFDLGDGTPALIFCGARTERTDGDTYHWVTGGLRGIWLYQDGTVVQYAPNSYSQAVFDGYLLTGGLFNGEHENSYQVYPISGGSIAEQPSTTADIDHDYRYDRYTYYIDHAEVSFDEISAWISRWVGTEYQADANFPWRGNSAPVAFNSESTDIDWTSWGLSPAEDVIAALEVIAGEGG